MRKRTFAIVALLLTVIITKAQDQPEYRMEIGAGAGLAAYVGDLNANPFKGMQPMGALVAKYKMNPRMACTINLGYGQLKGASADTDDWMPGLKDDPATFKSDIIDVQLRYEYNFWPFGTGREYHGAQPLTPFIAIGLGTCIGSAKVSQPTAGQSKESAVALQLPLGFGVKYKVADRLNLSAEWVIHFTTTDKLDGMEDPYGIPSQGLFKNKDSYSTLQLSLTYDLWERCKTCHNDRE